MPGTVLVTFISLNSFILKTIPQSYQVGTVTVSVIQEEIKARVM